MLRPLHCHIVLPTRNPSRAAAPAAAVTAAAFLTAAFYMAIAPTCPQRRGQQPYSCAMRKLSPAALTMPAGPRCTCACLLLLAGHGTGTAQRNCNLHLYGLRYTATLYCLRASLLALLLLLLLLLRSHSVSRVSAHLPVATH
jgi:hypothetical protein